jgi:hypothetical protein
MKPRTMLIAVMVLAGTTLPAPAETPIVDPKPPFSERHPRVYKIYRCGRKVCHIAKPFLDVAAATAQIVTPFVVR